MVCNVFTFWLSLKHTHCLSQVANSLENPSGRPPVKKNYLPFQGGTSFLDPFVICVSCLSRCLVCSLQPCGHLMEGADLFALLCVMFSCVFVAFPYGVLCQVWYLMVLIPDLCLLPYFAMNVLPVFPQ